MIGWTSTNFCSPTPVITASISRSCDTLSLHAISADTRATCAEVPVARRTMLNAALIGTTSSGVKPGRSGDEEGGADQHAGSEAAG